MLTYFFYIYSISFHYINLIRSRKSVPFQFYMWNLKGIAKTWAVKYALSGTPLRLELAPLGCTDLVPSQSQNIVHFVGGPYLGWELKTQGHAMNGR